MRVLTRDWWNVSRADVFTVVPIGDVHIGAAACDEDLLKQVVARIAGDERCAWIGLGDYCEWINVHDKRFQFSTLAPWVDVADLVDLAAAQRERFLDIVRPIAGQCLGLIKGNHEETIQHWTERDVYSEIVSAVKAAGGFESNHNLALGYYGWLRLVYHWGAEKRGGSCTITANLHHGWAAGRLGGAKALNMERWLWTHDCDLALFGHAHNADAYRRAVESLDRRGNLVTTVRRGGYGGTFLRTVNEGGASSYSERKGYLPLPIGGIEVELRPGQVDQGARVRLIT